MKKIFLLKKKIFSKVLFVVLLLIGSSMQKCGFDAEEQSQISITKLDLYGDKMRFLQSTTWAPIRIYVDYTHLDSQISIAGQEFIKDIKIVTDKAISAYQSLLKVRPSVTPIKLNDCAGKNLLIGNAVKNGVQADIVIFPLINPNLGINVEGSASYCAQDSQTNRPIAGFMNFNKNLKLSKKNVINYLALLTLHEMNHIFVFNYSLFSQFIDNDGKKIPIDQVVVTRTVNGVSRKMIATPKILAAAIKHFNCPTLEGLELENDRGSGTATHHWEERLMAGDNMIGENDDENVLSEMSLALFEDSGFYQVNYYTGGLFRYGKNQGCEFINTKCIKNGKTLFPNEFSTDKDDHEFCFAGRTSKGYSSLKSGRKVDNINFQYFSDKFEGGRPLPDFCPIAFAYSDDEYYFPRSCLIGISDEYPKSMGEKIGKNCSCFNSSLTPEKDRYVLDYKGVNSSICYEVHCDYINKL